jgi:hypothetical protein
VHIRMFRDLSIAMALCASGAAYAATDGFDACAQEQDAAKRLACFDRQIAARRNAEAPAKPAATPQAAPSSQAAPKPVPATPTTPQAAPASSGPAAAAPATKSATPQDVGLDGRELRRQRQQRGEEPHPESKVEISAKVVRVIERRPMIAAFELDNGQIWEQVETVSGLWIRPGESVNIRAGVMGGFLLKSGDGHVVRVHREK